MSRAAARRVDGEFVELIDPRDLTPGPTPADLDRYLRPEPFIESDAPEIKAEAEKWSPASPALAREPNG